MAQLDDLSEALAVFCREVAFGRGVCVQTTRARDRGAFGARGRFLPVIGPMWSAGKGNRRACDPRTAMGATMLF